MTQPDKITQKQIDALAQDTINYENPFDDPNYQHNNEMPIPPGSKLVFKNQTAVVRLTKDSP